MFLNYAAKFSDLFYFLLIVFPLEMGVKRHKSNGTTQTQHDTAKSFNSIFDGLVISFVGIVSALLIFAAVRNSFTW